MPKDDPAPSALVGRFGLAFAYLCFAVAIVTLSAAVYLLPLDLGAKIFLAAGGVLLVSMIAVLAVATHLVSRPRSASPSPASPNSASSKSASPKSASPKGKSSGKAASSPPSAGADGSQRPR